MFRRNEGDNDESQSENISATTQDTMDTDELLLGRRYNTLNGLDRTNSNEEDNRSELQGLGTRSIRLFNSDNDIDENSLRNDIHLIRREVFDFNQNFDEIIAENQRRESISIGNYSEIFESQLDHTEEEQSNLSDIKLNIGNYVPYLNEKLESLNLTDMDDELVPVLGSTLHQLEDIAEKLRSTMTDEIITLPQLGNNILYMNRRVHSPTESPVDVLPKLAFKFNHLQMRSPSVDDKHSDQFNLDLNLGISLQLLSDRTEKLKKILYRRYRAKLEELFEKFQFKQQADFEDQKQRMNSDFDLDLYSKYCIQSRKSQNQSRAFFREKLRDDLQFRHNYHVFLDKYNKNLFRLILNESNHYIPKSESLRQCLSNDQRYYLYKDFEQLKKILQFLKDISALKDLSEFHRYTETESVLLNLFLEHTKKFQGEIQNDYLNSLKESYAVFIRDHILKLTERDENHFDSKDDIRTQFDQIKHFNEEILKTIQDVERRKKISFLKEWKGETWEKKLIQDHIEFDDYTITEFTNAEDRTVKELESDWLNDKKNWDKYSTYETYVMTMTDSKTKSEHLLKISQIYQNKKPRLRLYLKKSIDFLKKYIAIEEFIIKNSNTNLNEISTKRTQLREKYQLRALIHLSMAKTYDYPCFDKFQCFNKSKHDLIQFDKQTMNESNILFHSKDFIHRFKEAFLADNRSSIYSYDEILTINPYFFEAQYQKLLKLYELNNSNQITHLHSTFDHLIRSKQPIHDLFQILLNKTKTKSKFLNQPENYLNKIIKIKVRNNQRKSFYLQLIKTEDSYQMKFNNEEQLINLLKYGKINMKQMKDHLHSSLKLSYQLSNVQFQQLIQNFWENIRKQESNFSQLIESFKFLELTNEKQYENLDLNFLNLLPETQFDFIRICSSCFQCICEISKCLKEFHPIQHIDKNIKRKIKSLQFIRADIYRESHYFSLEELQLKEILNHQRTGPDHNPIIYYRLACLYKKRRNLQESIRLIHLANQRYNEKMNKNIFKKIQKLKSELIQLENTKNDELTFIQQNHINLLQILNCHLKQNLEPTLSIPNGLEFFEDQSTNGLLNCLFSHLIEDIHSIEEYFQNHQNSLTQKYNELREELQTNNCREFVIESFNKKFGTKFRCLFIEKNHDDKDFNFESDEIPIILFKNSQSNQYKTPKKLNHFMLLTSLITRPDAKADLKSICYQFLKEEIEKNLQTQSTENQTIERFLKLMVECETMKEFTEDVVYYLMRNTYQENSFHFWSFIADLEYNIDLKDTLHLFKELFIESIDEYHQEEEEKHQSALELIESLIEQNKRDQRSLKLLTKLKDEILRCLSIYDYVKPTSKRRERVMEIISSNYEIGEKLRKLMLDDCFNIQLDFENPDEKEHFLQYLTSDAADEIGFRICSIIEKALKEPKMKIHKKIIIIKGYNIFLNEMLESIEEELEESKKSEVRLYGTNVFVDCSLIEECWKGINLTIGADIIEFVKEVVEDESDDETEDESDDESDNESDNESDDESDDDTEDESDNESDDESKRKITIDLSGKDGKNGANAKHRRHATRESEDGMDGLPGGNGKPGKNGGNIYFVANKEFRGRKNIEKLITSGGKGGKGGNGGNGGDGHDGKDGQNASEGHNIKWYLYGSQLKKGTNGTPGGDGGRGGNCGLGAFGGHAGDIHIEENQRSIVKKFKEIVESEDRSNTSGKDGPVGKGGKGGKGGTDGTDILYVDPGMFWKNQKVTGNIEITGTEDPFFGPHTVHHKQRENIVKKSGIQKTTGKTAEAQLHAGKTRRKCEEKQKSDEKGIKKQLNQMMNNSNEELSNISNTITQSMNLLKDQMDDIVDERESKVKTHQLSSSLIENAYQIAQQSLALNATKIKTKTENNILKEAEKNQTNEKFYNQIDLILDQVEQQPITFKKDTRFIEDLKIEYDQKRESYVSSHLFITKSGRKQKYRVFVMTRHGVRNGKYRVFRKVRRNVVHPQKLTQLKQTLKDRIKRTKQDIKNLQSEGRNILYKLDIDSMKTSYLHGSNEEMESNFFDIVRFESNLNNELTLIQGLSGLSSDYQNILYKSDLTNYQPYLLKEHFTKLRELKKKKQLLTCTLHRINKLNMDKIIEEICLEYGRKELIKQKLSKFNQIINSDQLENNQYLKSFDIHQFIKQNDFLMDDPISYKPYLTGFFKNQTDDPMFIDEICNILIQSNIPLSRIEKSETFLSFLFRILKENENLKQFQLIDCTPIYHRPPLQAHLIEKLINDFIFAPEKTIEHMEAIFKCFLQIIQTDQCELLCRRKIENFMEFFVVNLIFLRVDIKQGRLLNLMKRNLNSIQINYSTSIFDRLELIILIKERQFEKFYNYLEKVQTFFRTKQKKSDSDIRIINFIKHDKQPNIYTLFNDPVNNTNPPIQEFSRNLYLEEDFKDQMELVLRKFHNYWENLKEIRYKDVLKDKKKLFFDKLHAFLKKQKKEVKKDIEYFLLSKEKCENIVYLSYKNISLRTNINCLHQVDTDEDICVEDFIQSFKTLYEQLRLKEITEINKSSQPRSSGNIEEDVHRNTSIILLLSREMDSDEEIQIKKGDRIIIIKTDQFRIYYRNQTNYQIQNHQIDKADILQILNLFNFSENISLSKKDNPDIYKMIYEDVRSKNGFIEYSIEQIGLFTKFKETVDEKLISMKTSLPTNFFDHITNEINRIYQSETPDAWALKISFIFSNINIIIKIKTQFDLTTNNPIEKCDFTDKNVIEILNDLMKDLFEQDKENKLTIFYQCLSIFDYLLLKITDDESIYPLGDITKMIPEQKDALEVQIAHEIQLKINQLFKQYYFNELSKRFQQEKERHSDKIDLIPSIELDLKQRSKELFTSRFNQLIIKTSLALFDFIDEIYHQSSKKLDISTKRDVYIELDKLMNDFHIDIPSNSIHIPENFLESSIIFLIYLQKYSLIFISGLDRIDNQINEILNELKTTSRIMKKCPLRFLSSDRLEEMADFTDEIIITKGNPNQIQIFFKDFTNNNIDSFILRQEQDKELFQLLNTSKNMDLIDEEHQTEEYQKLYSMIKSKNGTTYQNKILFDEKIFIQIFINQILNNLNNIPIEKFKQYISSFEIIFQNTNINPDILTLLDEKYHDIMKQINNEERIQLLEPFDLFIEENYQTHKSNLQTGFANLMFDLQRKNRILNITWKYLNNSKEKNDPPIQFEQNQLMNITADITRIFAENQFRIQDIVSCYQQLNKALIQTPFNTLQIFKKQLEILNIKIRQFIENIDFPKDYSLKDHFNTFNNDLKQTGTLKNISILDLLKAVLRNNQKIESEYSQSILKKILFNFQVNNEEFQLNIYQEIEKEIKEFNQFESIKKDYLTFVTETIQKQLKSLYKNQLDVYEETKKKLNDSIKEILDLFWSNISMSDLLNKEREKTYLNLNIEKLLQISNENKPNILNQILTKLKKLQTNPDKKQLTIKLHQYLNNMINQKLRFEEIIMPIKCDGLRNLSKKNDVHEDPLVIFEKLADLLEMSIDRFDQRSIYNEFFRSFTKIFRYFSWRLPEYESKQEKITKITDKFTAAIKTFKVKAGEIKKKDPHSDFNKFDELEKIFNLRAHESQLQEELNNIQNENLQKLKLIDNIVNLWLKKLEKCKSNAGSLADVIFRDIHQLFSKTTEDLIEFQKNQSESSEGSETTNVPPTTSSESNENEEEAPPDQSEEPTWNKMNFELRFSILNSFSLQVINQKETWEEKKDLIKNFDLIKEKLFEDYLESIYKEKSDNSIDYQTWKDSAHIQNLKEIFTQNYVQEWDQEINNLSINLFIKNLLQFYNLNFDTLRNHFHFIEAFFKQNEKDDMFLSLTWESEVKDNNDFMEIIDFLMKFSQEQAPSENPLTFTTDLMNEFIKNIQSIKELKTSIDTCYFFLGYDNLVKLGDLLDLKLIRPQSKQMNMKRLTSLFTLLSNFDDFNQVFDLLKNSHLNNWLLYLNITKTQSNLTILFNRYLDELNLNEMIIDNSRQLDEFIENKLNETEIQYENSLKKIFNNLKLIELNTNIDLHDKERFFTFLQIPLTVELKKDANYLIKFNELEKIFNEYLIQLNILDKVIKSLRMENDKIEKSEAKNDHLIIENITSKSFINLLPYLIRFSIIERLQLDRKALEDEQIKIIEYLELIKTLYSEEKMFQLVDVIEELCQKEKEIIPYSIIDLLKNISNNDWLLNSDILYIMKTVHIDQWEKRINDYMKEKRLKKRDIREIIDLMKEDKNNLNTSIKKYLESDMIFHDLTLLIDKRKEFERWEKDNIQKWATEIRGNKLLSDKQQVQEAIVIVSRAIYLFTRDSSKDRKSGFYPRETQITALWLFLNPDLNQTNRGCLAQISTGEGKSIIVAALAAIKALSCHRVDIITSSSVLAIRDAEEFQPFYQMFDLQVSNNCDVLCEQGDGELPAESVRRSRYCNDKGPVDIIYGECSCFERDILITEINRSENIIGQRMSDNCTSSVIIDEVDSMLLDKANMVLYLSHNIDTLKSLERLFISIWQSINQPAFEQFQREAIDDDLIQVVSEMMLEQIDNKTIDVPEYDSNQCDYINLKLFIKRRMPTWIRSAFHVRDMVPNDTYIISRDQSDQSSKGEVKITVMDKDTGTEQLSTRWSNGVHQFLQLKHTRRLTSESLKAVFMSNMSFFKRYKHHIVGLTGSLGSIDEQKLLDQVYKLRFFVLPRFRQEQFRELQGSVFAEQDGWLEAIQNALDKQIRLKSTGHDQRRAVLIICENVKSVLVLKEYLSNSYPDAKVYKSAYEKFEMEQLNPGDIIIATNLAGRGTDLDTSEKLEENGGLHVITTYLPTNIRIEMQAFGRTARKGNKGTGEYIIQSQYGLSIEKLKQLRNMLESERLNLFLINDLPRIKIEEDLLQGFHDDESHLSCIGFVQLYRNVENTLKNDSKISNHGTDYIEFQLYSLKNRWAFWLDSMTEYINMINVIGKTKIIEKFNEFRKKVEKDVQADNFEKLIIEPAEFIKLGRCYRKEGNWSKAIECYERASKDKFYLFSNYYTSACYQNRDYANGLQGKKEFKRRLYDVRASIEKELQFLQNAAQVAFEMGEKNRRLGYASYGNEYDDQVKEKSTIWNIFLGSITNALGCPIGPKDLMSTKYLSNEKDAEEFYKEFERKNFIKRSRVTKKGIEQIELPSIFNNKRTKEKLLHYLQRKSRERKNNGGEIDEEIFKKDVKKNPIFLPYQGALIDFIVQQGFIEKINRNEQPPLYGFLHFNEENLEKKPFPQQISNLKKTLFDCSKEITKENEFRGTKTELRDRFNSILTSKKQKHLTNNQFDTFCQFLTENSCLEKLTSYLVRKDQIIKQNTDHNYVYSNFYDFQRHYTEKFREFELVFRQNFLKIILLQQNTENGDSYFTLKDTIDSNEFEVVKSEDDALDCLWGYLKNSSFIKPARINIGFKIGSEEVKKKQEEIRKEIKSYFERTLSGDREKELEEAVNTVFGIIDQTIGELKKIPDDKTITSFLDIKQSYFIDNRKAVPPALEEFIELALDVIFRLEEKKEPPKWYEIAAVIALGVVQVVAGVLAKMFIPVVGHLIGEFLISTGCDDIIFGVQCAISGEFSWEKYWQHKKQSMINAALVAVCFVAISFIKHAMKLNSVKKAWAFQKLTGAQRLHAAATKLGTTANIGRQIGKEIAKTLVQTGVSQLASIGIENMLEMVSNKYEFELQSSIKYSVENKWEQVQVEIEEFFRLCEGSEQSKSIIENCIKRKLQNLPEATFLKNLTNRCAPVMQGVGRALAGGSGRYSTLIDVFTNYAPSIANLGINIGELAVMIDGFLKNLANDIRDARKKLDQTNKQYVLTNSQTDTLRKFEAVKIDQISRVLSDSFNEKLKHGILAPVLNFAANKLISKGLESVAGTNRTEQLASRFELIHAAINPNDTLMRYADDLIVFLAGAREVKIKDLNVDPKEIQPANLNGQTLQQVYDLYGERVKTFMDRDGKVYVRRPTSKEYYNSIRCDKPASLHEQRKIPEVLGCEITHGEKVNNEQQCTLTRPDGKKVISFFVRDNLDGSKHAVILDDGKPMDILTFGGNENDCYYNVALIANEMSQGKTFDQAIQVLDNKDAVKNLRNEVSLAMRNDKVLLSEFKWTNRVNLDAHFQSLTGMFVDWRGDLRLLDQDLANIKDMILTFKTFTKGKQESFKRKFKGQTLRKGVDENDQTIGLSHHHLIPKKEILDELHTIAANTTNKQFKTQLENYLNNPVNRKLRDLVIKEVGASLGNTIPDRDALFKATLWNPNNVVPGPEGSKLRVNDPHSGRDTELCTARDTIIIENQTLNMLEKLTLMGKQSRGIPTWIRDPTDSKQRFKFSSYLPGQETADNYLISNDPRRVKLYEGTL